MQSATMDILGEFERSVWTRDRAASARKLLEILRGMNRNAGALPAERRKGRAVFPQHGASERATRIAAAAGEMFADPEFRINGRMFAAFIPYHRWLHTLFAASSFGNADRVLARIGLSDTAQVIGGASGPDLLKLCLLYGQESELPLDMTALFAKSPQLACALGVALLSNRLVATPGAYAKRESLLKWMTEALDRLERMDGLPSEILVDVWMHASYASYRGKHDIKRPLNRLIRRHLARQGYQDPELVAADGERKTVFVVVEWFHKTHSIMRTHSVSLRALKENYRLVGFGPRGMVDEEGKAVFDEFHDLGAYSPSLEFAGNVLDLARRYRPAAVYYPSIGMAAHSIILANLRLAPVQIMALGHPATTHSDKIDYALVEEDYIGDASLFSEKLVPLPKNAIPYMEPSLPHPVQASLKPGGVVRVAVPSAVMKINPAFLSACMAAQAKSPTEIQFHFMMGGSYGPVHDYVSKSIKTQLPGAVVHHTLPYSEYMSIIASCDLFANPFPFGNTNGIVDCVYAGVPGICFSGDEVHSHIDEGLFRRMGFPEWTIAGNVEEYVAALLRMVDEADFRREWSRSLIADRPDKVLYGGAPKAFADIFAGLLR